MDWKKELYGKDEKPLDRLVDGYSYTSVFRKIAFIGDSLSSGEFQLRDPEGKMKYHDIFEYSWGQYIARKNGLTAYNFSRGGMTAKEYIESFADDNDYWNPIKKATAYIIALGVNDLLNMKQPIGTISDIDLENLNNNKDTFAGWYGRIIQKYKEINPNAKFFFVSMPKENSLDDKNNPIKKEHANLLHDLTKIFSNSYVIDLFQYAPIYDTNFKEKFYLEDHMNPAGYRLTGIMIASYIDYIIRSDFKAFKQVGFIGCKEYKKELE